MAYFPIVFSAYPLSNGAPAEVKQGHGVWRTTGFGVVCIEAVDFAAAGGIATTRGQWGGEDTQFYGKILKGRRLEVVRAIDEGLLHRYHEMNCTGLEPLQRIGCLQMQAELSGSKLSLRQQIDSK